MFKKKFNAQLVLGLLCSSLLSSTIYATQDVAYITVLGGAALPLASSFKVETTDEATQKLKESKGIPGNYYQAWSGAVGFYMTPKLGLELSVDYTPKYLLSVELHDNLGTAKTDLESYSINLGAIYNVGEYGGFSPYLVGGGGWATFKSTGSDYLKKADGKEIFKLLSSTGDGVVTSFLGIGITKAITTNIRLNLQIKGQLYHGIKMNYEKINTLKGTLDPHTIEKTFGVVKGQLGLMIAL